LLLRAWSAVYWAAIVVTAPLFFVVAVLVWAVTLPFDRRKVVLHQYSCWWAMVFVYVNPLWRLTVTGRDRLPWRGGAVLVANHSSLIDIIVLFGLYRPFKWVSKHENFKLPFIGWNMRLNGYVPLIRGDRASVEAMFARCGELLDQGSPLMIFPEGTRSRDGRLKPFKDGAFTLAVDHEVPLIPIAVHGTGRALAAKSMVLREHVRAKVEILEPLDPADFADADALRDEAHRRIAAALGQTS
jgi:1-acyl-sn-glycerol-3-phosphate acyltransferase